MAWLETHEALLGDFREWRPHGQHQLRWLTSVGGAGVNGRPTSVEKQAKMDEGWDASRDK